MNKNESLLETGAKVCSLPRSYRRKQNKKLVNLKLVENSLKIILNSFDFCTCWRHVAQKYMSPDVYQC